MWGGGGGGEVYTKEAIPTCRNALLRHIISFRCCDRVHGITLSTIIPERCRLDDTRRGCGCFNVSAALFFQVKLLDAEYTDRRNIVVLEHDNLAAVDDDAFAEEGAVKRQRLILPSLATNVEAELVVDFVKVVSKDRNRATKMGCVMDEVVVTFGAMAMREAAL